MTVEAITQYDLAEIFNKAYTKVATMDKAQAGFRATGIWPFEPEVFTDGDFLAASFHTPVLIDENVPTVDGEEDVNKEYQKKIPETELENLPSTSTQALKNNAETPTSNKEVIKSSETNIPSAIKYNVLEELSPLPKPSIKKDKIAKNKNPKFLLKRRIEKN